VRLIKVVKQDEGLLCWGTWEASTRMIRLERAAPPEHRWRVLYHEWAHAVLDDSGITNLLTPDAVEMLCDAFATARMQELRGVLGMAN